MHQYIGTICWIDRSKWVLSSAYCVSKSVLDLQAHAHVVVYLLVYLIYICSFATAQTREENKNTHTHTTNSVFRNSNGESICWLCILHLCSLSNGISIESNRSHHFFLGITHKWQHFSQKRRSPLLCRFYSRPRNRPTTIERRNKNNSSTTTDDCKSFRTESRLFSVYSRYRFSLLFSFHIST